MTTALSHTENPLRGLSSGEAEKRLRQYGSNALQEKKTSALLNLLGYFWGPIPWMIEVAASLSALARHWDDFVIIIVLLRIGIGIVLFLPTLMVSLCCLLWPLLLVLQGAVTAYFSTVWTLAWREWTAQPPAQQSPELLEVSQ